MIVEKGTIVQEPTTRTVGIDNEDYVIVIDPATGNATSYSNGKLGDATKETGPFYYYNGNSRNNWYAENTDFLESSRSWFVRGGTATFGIGSGPFGFSRRAGGADPVNGFRLVLTP